jgi:hypothetical protein
MGRQLRRMMMDFDWPMNKVWEGFLNPHYVAIRCADCPTDYSGASPQMAILRNRWYGYYEDFRPEDRGSISLTPETPVVWAFAERNVQRAPEYFGDPTASNIHREASRLADMWNQQWSHHLNQDDVDALVKEKRLVDLTHSWKDGKWVKRRGVKLTATQVNEWSIIGGFGGHDSINQWIVCKAECVRQGWPINCLTCKGKGEFWPSKKAEKLYNDWEPSEPLEGPGYQMWETVSEGSPISPVFATPEELASWLVNHRPSDGSFDSWMNMITNGGWSPSLMIENGRLMTGVDALGDKREYIDDLIG